MPRKPLVMYEIRQQELAGDMSYVGRLWENGRETDRVYLADTLGELRLMFYEAGFACVPRDDSDEPEIVERWY